MLLTLAIVRGFKQQITEKIVGFDAQISIVAHDSSYENELPITLTPTLHDMLRQAVPAARIDASIAQPAMLKTNDHFAAVVFRCYGDSKDWSFISDNIVEGNLPDYTSSAATSDASGNDSIKNAIVISKTIADELQLSVGEKIPTIFIVDNRMRMRNFVVAAIYESHISDYDKTVAFAPISTLRSLLGLAPNQSTRLEISGLSLDDVPEAQMEVHYALSNAYYIGETETILHAQSVLQTGAIYFNWLELLDANVVVIIQLMSAISIFTLVASLFILILERVNLIGTLKTLGSANVSVRKIFIYVAARILLRGLLIGNAIGLAIIVIQYYTHILPLDPESYYISFVPVSITIWQVLTLNIVAVVSAMAVMIIPSMVITRMQPARILRFE